MSALPEPLLAHCNHMSLAPAPHLFIVTSAQLICTLHCALHACLSICTLLALRAGSGWRRAHSSRHRGGAHGAAQQRPSLSSQLPQQRQPSAAAAAWPACRGDVTVPLPALGSVAQSCPVSIWQEPRTGHWATSWQRWRLRRQQGRRRRQQRTAVVRQAHCRPCPSPLLSAARGCCSVRRARGCELRRRLCWSRWALQHGWPVDHCMHSSS